MERVETLLKKLQEQYAQNAPAGQLLLTVQLLQAELLQLQGPDAPDSDVAITLSQVNFNTPAPVQEPVIPAQPEEEKIIEVLQVDEAEIEAELEEIKKNAESIQKFSSHHKPSILFEPEEEEDIPTLSHQRSVKPEPVQKEINETVESGATSLNEKLKQSRIDLGELLVEQPIRDLRKAIGVNDRFLFINTLFRGDEAVYERSIKTINGFSILPEAEYWIERELKVKHGWKVDDEVVKQFYQLVKRRFS
ncbi:MAG: hypothetical protein IPI66_11620 [Chitinophagaceae bacterium]|nr:hypothetical protein [Chitinophagaceae bacterium]MBL0056204.1 hypothetical protein [Chitinophagaceae bacterium]